MKNGKSRTKGSDWTLGPWLIPPRLTGTHGPVTASAAAMSELQSARPQLTTLPPVPELTPSWSTPFPATSPPRCHLY